MKTVKVSTAVELREDGVLGAWLFALAPIGGAAAWFWYGYIAAEAARRSYYSGPSPWLPALIMLLCGLAWSWGVVLLLVGRRYEHRVQIVDAEAEPTPGPNDPEPEPLPEWAQAWSSKGNR